MLVPDPAQRRRTRWAPMLGLAAVVTAGCTTYTSSVRPVENMLAAGQPGEALLLLEKNGDSGLGQVLYELNRGILYRAAGDYVASNAAFEEAKLKMEALYGVSVTEQTGSLILNEGTIAFKGEPFEQTMLHAYKALNYLELGDLDAARVEVLQADLKMTTVGGDGYGENGFMRYLSGIVFESHGEGDNAYIAYRKAYEYYRGNPVGLAVPAPLRRDLLRLAEQQGRDDDVREYRLEWDWDADPGPQQPESACELVVLLHGDLVPPKRERIASIFHPELRILVNVALPYYEPYDEPIAGVRVRAGKRYVAAVKVEDVAAQARHALDERLGAIAARALARAAVKATVSYQLGEQNDLLGALANLAAVVTERADTRSWSTLPGTIWLARLPIPAGEQRMAVEVEGRYGGRVAVLERDLSVAAGETRVVSFHWFGADSAGGRL